jgi:hypothetical protein
MREAMIDVGVSFARAWRRFRAIDLIGLHLTDFLGLKIDSSLLLAFLVIAGRTHG